MAVKWLMLFFATMLFVKDVSVQNQTVQQTIIPFTLLPSYASLNLHSSMSTMPNYSRKTVSPAVDQRSCDEKTSNFNLVVFVSMVILVPITVGGNGLVFTVIAFSPQLRKQTTYLFLLSLSLTDMLLGIIIIPLRAKKSWNNNLFCVPVYLCWLFNLLEFLLSMTSVMHLQIIGIDRFLALKYVYQYEVHMTRRKCVIVIIATWVFATSMTSSAIFRWDKPKQLSISHSTNKLCFIDNPTYYTFIVALLFYLPLPLIVYTYQYVYHTACRHINDIVRMDVGCEKSKQLKKKRKQLRLFRSIIVLFVAFVICWIPTTVFNLFTIYLRDYLYHLRFKVWFRALYFMLIYFLPPLNSAVNPLIYVVCNHQFRKALGQLLRRRKLHFYNNSMNTSMSGKTSFRINTKKLSVSGEKRMSTSVSTHTCFVNLASPNHETIAEHEQKYKVVTIYNTFLPDPVVETSNL